MRIPNEMFPKCGVFSSVCNSADLIYVRFNCFLNILDENMYINERYS